MKLSLFKHAKDNDPQVWDCSFNEFIQQFGPHVYINIDVSTPERLEAAKEALPAFSPAEYPEGVTRRKDTVLQVNLLVFDVDNATEEEFEEFIKRAIGLKMVVCSTFSRGIKSGVRVRAIFPLSRPVKGSDWEKFFNLANRFFGNIGDPKCKNADRIFFGCYAPKSMENSGQHFYDWQDGEDFPVDDLFQMPTDDFPPPLPDEVHPITLDQLKRFSKTLIRSKSEHKQDMGECLKKICDGETFAEPGNRDNILFKLSKVLAERFPEADPTSVAKHFEPSLSRMAQASPNCPTIDNVEYKMQRALEELRRDQNEVEKKIEQKSRKKISYCFGGKRSEPYTEEELESFGEDVMWVVQKEGSYYFFVNGQFIGPFTESEASNASLVYLAPASAVVELYKMHNGERVLKSINELVKAYGIVAKEVHVSLAAQNSSFDIDTLTLTEAPCPLRDIKPVFHQDVDTWFHLLTGGGEKERQFRSWMAAATWLDRVCVILFMTGPKGVGKSLLAKGVSRLWTTTGPAPLELVFGPFNDVLLRCPLCFADEQLPQDFRGYTKNGDLRRHVQEEERPLKRKFLPVASCRGATRTMVAANNEDILKTQEELTENDIGAIADRYLHIPCFVEAKQYLERIDTSKWVREDHIAEHVLWLRDNYKWEPEGRFMIVNRDERLTRSLATRANIPSMVCQWICGYLLRPTIFHDDHRSNMLVRIYGGRVLVNTQGIVSCWVLYVGNDKCPSTGKLSTAVKALSTGERTKMNDERGSQTNYRIIDIKNIVEWAEHTGYATEEQIHDALKVDTPPREQMRRPAGSLPN